MGGTSAPSRLVRIRVRVAPRCSPLACPRRRLRHLTLPFFPESRRATAGDLSSDPQLLETADLATYTSRVSQLGWRSALQESTIGKHTHLPALKVEKSQLPPVGPSLPSKPQQRPSTRSQRTSTALGAERLPPRCTSPHSSAHSSLHLHRPLPRSSQSRLRVPSHLALPRVAPSSSSRYDASAEHERDDGCRGRNLVAGGEDEVGSAAHGDGGRREEDCSRLYSSGSGSRVSHRSCAELMS